MKEIAERVSVEGSELVMSTTEKLRQEGVADGMFKKARQMVEKMIVNGEPLEK